MLIAMRKPRRRAAAGPACALLTVFAVSTQALAAPPEDAGPEESDGDQEAVEQAMEAFQRGVSLYDQADYERALEAFLEASSYFPSPDFQFNIGNCYEKLEKYEDAIRAYRTYLRTKPDATDAGEVKLKIEQLKVRQKQAEEEERKRREAELAANKETIVIDGGGDGKGLIISGAALLGIGAAVGIGGGVAFGVLAGQRSSTIDDLNAGINPDGLTFAEAQDVERQGQSFETWQLVTSGVGAGVAIAGTIMLAVGVARKNDREKQRQQLENKPKPEAFFSPTFGRNGAGFSITGRF